MVDTPYFALTDQQGRFQIDKVPRGEYEVLVWHEEIGDLPVTAGPTSIVLGRLDREPLEYVVTP